MKPTYIVEAEKLLGEREIKGKRHNQQIVDLYADSGNAGVTRDEVAWCAAFVGATLRRAGFKSTGSLAARSYESYGTKLKGPQKYCIGVMKWTNSGWAGHVGYVVDYNSKYVWMLGGNQSDRVKISRYSRHGGRLQFTAYVLPEKRYSGADLVNRSKKLKSAETVQNATAVGGVSMATAWQWLPQIKDFAADNVGLILLGISGVVLGGLYVWKKWVKEDYTSGRYIPSGQDSDIEMESE